MGKKKNKIRGIGDLYNDNYKFSAVLSRALTLTWYADGSLQSQPTKRTYKKGTTLSFTGDYLTVNNINYLLFHSSDSRDGYLSWTYDNIAKLAPSNDTAVYQNYLADTIAYNKSILDNNLLCGRMLNYINSAGKKVKSTSVEKLEKLQANLNERNNALKNSGISYQEMQTPLSAYKTDLENVLQNKNAYIGIAPVVWIVIIAVGIIGATVAVSWGFFKSSYLSAKSDFALSNGLVEDLKKYLPDNVYRQLMAENDHNAAVASAAIKAAEGNRWKNYGLLAAGVGVFFASKPIMERLGLIK